MPVKQKLLMDLLLKCKPENKNKVGEMLKKDEEVSMASITAKDGKVIDKDGFYFYLEGDEKKLSKAKKLVEGLAEEVTGKEKEEVVSAIKAEESRALEGFGAILG